VAAARGVTPEAFDGFDPVAYLPATSQDAGQDAGYDGGRSAAERSLDDLVAFNRRSAKTHSGIWRDLAVRKRRTEVDAQLGIVVALAHEAGVSAPLTTRLVELIHDIENGVRPQSLATLDLLTADLASPRTGLPSVPGHEPRGAT
jgi:2-dehydropantoate 2-reductase